MSFHKDEATGSIHIPYQWSYADASARTGASGFVAGDVGKLARQEDNNSLWILTSTAPTWVQVGGGSAPGAHAATHENGGSDEISVAGLSGTLADAQNADQLQGRAVDSGAPTSEQVLKWSGSAWAPADETGVDEDKVIYVGKHGNNSLDGRTVEKAVLTFAQARTLVAAQSPGASNRWTIVCLDAGIYTESITGLAYCNIFAPAATVQGAHTLVDDADWNFYAIIATSGVAITKSSGTAVTRVTCEIMVLTGAAGGLLVTAGAVCFTSKFLQLENGYGVGSLASTDVGVFFGQIYINGTGIGMGISSTGTQGICARGMCIKDTGSGTAVSVLGSTGVIDLNLSYINCATAVSVNAGTTLNLVANKVTGTRTVSGTLNAVIVEEHAQRFDAYDGTGGTSTSGTWVDVPLDTEREKTGDFTHTGSSAEVTVAKAGVYKVTARVSVEETASSDALAEMRIAKDSGSGYAGVAGTAGYVFLPATDGAGTMEVTALLTLAASDKLKVQFQRASGSGTVEALADGSSLTIEMR